MIKQTIFLLVSCWILASVFAFQPTPIQQFLVLPSNADNFDSPAWHIGDDIVAFYQSISADLSEGYLKITPGTSQVERILVDTVASCQRDISLLDPSYYHPSIGTLLYYCVANNSLLTIGQNYTVQDALPISTSQTFKDVIIGHNEQGYVYILGLPDIMSLPATAPTELILVDLKTKAVENHMVFNKGSDSQVLVTGYAFDSSAGVSYIQTKELEGDQNLVRISKIALSGNDYELTPFANFTYAKENPQYSFHNCLHIINGYLFTNDNSSLLIFDKNGNLYQGQEGLNFVPIMKNLMKFERILVPQVAAQIGGSTLYASLDMGRPGLAYSFENGKMTSSVIDYSSNGMLFALGGLTSGDLLIGLNDFTFNIRDAKTNATLYSSFRSYDDIMMSASHYGVLSYGNLYVFDRKKPEQLPQLISTSGSSWLDKTTNMLVTLPFSPMSDCQVTYVDLETLAVRSGPMIAQAACSIIEHVNLTDLPRPFFITNAGDGNHYFISPATYGTILWKCPNFGQAEGIVVPGDNAESFTYVWNARGNLSVVHIDSYKYDKAAKSFTLRDSYALTTTIQTKEMKYFDLGNSKVVLTYDSNVAVVDLALRNYKTFEVPAYYDSPKGVGILYDKNKIPYVSLAEVKEFGAPTTPPQLLDFTSGVTTMPGVIPDLTRTASVVRNCSYALADEFDNTIWVVRLYDICQGGGQGTEKISL